MASREAKVWRQPWNRKSGILGLLQGWPPVPLKVVEDRPSGEQNT